MAAIFEEKILTPDEPDDENPDMLCDRCNQTQQRLLSLQIGQDAFPDVDLHICETCLLYFIEFLRRVN